MKKISLKDVNLNGIEQLSRDELKKVLGGFDGGYGGYGDGGYGDYGGYGEDGMCDQESECSHDSDCGYMGKWTCESLTIKCNGVDYSWTKCKAVTQSA